MVFFCNSLANHYIFGTLYMYLICQQVCFIEYVHSSFQLKCCNGDTTHACCTGNLSHNTQECPCGTCYEKVKPNVNKAFALSGGLGLFFSFTEVSKWFSYSWLIMTSPSKPINQFYQNLAGMFLAWPKLIKQNSSCHGNHEKSSFKPQTL